MLNFFKGQANKFIVAVLGTIVTWLAGHGIHIDPATVQVVGGLITSGLVWLVPNLKKV